MVHILVFVAVGLIAAEVVVVPVVVVIVVIVVTGITPNRCRDSAVERMSFVGWEGWGGQDNGINNCSPNSRSLKSKALT